MPSDSTTATLQAATPGRGHPMRNFWLDACRAAAISMVLISHGRHFLTPVWSGAEAFRIGGFLGVELFFVLSGFLVGSIVWRHFGDASSGAPWLKTFLARRWLRTLPNFFLFLAVNLVMIQSGFAPGNAVDLLWFPVFMQNLAWSHPAAFGEAWSLSVEEIFYLLLPLLLIAAQRYLPGRDTARKFLIVVSAMILLPLLLRAIAVIWGDPSWDAGIRKIVIFRLDALMIGVLAGWLEHRYDVSRKIGAVSCAGLALALLAWIAWTFRQGPGFLDQDFIARVWLFPVTSLSFALLLLAGLWTVRAPQRGGPLIQTCARSSYALYLSHMPVFYLMAAIAGYPGEEDPAGAAARWVFYIVASLMLANAVERWFERPVLTWRDRVFADPATAENEPERGRSGWWPGN
ncbi:MAG: acyltransferase [Methylobacterium sp.]|nr:acyltransferase [Methylobacterium sp.]